jgi:hypothetical protein
VITLHTYSVGAPQFARDGYHIAQDSPAVDAALDVGVPIDLDGDPRPWGAAPDLGADEYYVYYVYLPAMVRRH